MFNTISYAFQADAPKAEIHPTPSLKGEDEYYFQLLADYGIRLNEPQKEAVKAVEGPVLLIAGAGSGKTTVLTSRIGYMIQTCKIDPSSILLMTFTKKASIDMIERLTHIPGINRRASRSVVAGTYHSICLKILRAEGYQFSVLSSDKKKHYMIKMILKKMNLNDSYSPEVIINLISSWKNQMIQPHHIEETEVIDKELKEIYKQYEQVKEQEDLYDFDDMLLEVYNLFTFRPEILRKYQNRFQYIMCDEFQDTSRIQYELIKLLAEPSQNLCIVGDDSQCIYGFRSASAQFMIDFDKIYRNCKKIIMDINYRSGAMVVGLANNIIHHNDKQIKKTLKVSNAEHHNVYFSSPRDSDDEANSIVEDIKEKLTAGVSLSDIAVLYRTHANGRAIFEKLLMADIPFITFGRKNDSLYQNSIIKPLLALLKASTNYMDAEAIINSASILYISKKEMENTIDEISVSYLGETPKDLFIQVINRIADRKSDFQKKQLISKLDVIKKLKKLTAPAAIKELRSGTIDYEGQLELDERKTLTIHNEVLLEMLDEFEQAARGFKNIEEFLYFINLVEEKNADMEELRNNPDIDAVRLMTIHASKGLEFSYVYSLGWVEGMIPHAASLKTEKKDTGLSLTELLEEERRLAYVCVTRAKKELYISSPHTHRGEQVETSRFLFEGMSVKREENKLCINY